MRAFEDEIFSKFVRTPTSDDLVDIFCLVSIQQLQLQYYHFPLFKTQFIRDAHAYTVAPDNWKVLLSQHRRWINSTVHNLGKLVFLEQLCGFCCFSMRFVVMIDLLSTLIQPVSVAYLSYVITLHSLIIDFSSRCISYISCILLSQRAKPSLWYH
jgi:hypothetical protein